MLLSDLRQDTKNANIGTDRGNDSISHSLKTLGAGRSILCDRYGNVIAGNKTVTAALKSGIDADAIVIQTDGSKLVVVQRTDLDLQKDNRAKLLAIADNRTAQLNLEWDTDVLTELAQELDLQPFFSTEELQELDIDLDGEEVDDTDPELPSLISDKQIIEAAFTYFRATGFPYRKLPLHICMQELNQLSQTKPSKLIGTNAGYQIADTYHPHRFHAAASGMKAPYDSFNDDKLLRKALTWALETSNIPAGYFAALSLVSGTQSCSNFRPGFACYLYKRYCKPGDTVLDTSTGYGGRLVGYLASGIGGKYIGIDPNTLTHAGNLKLAADLGFTSSVELHNLPAEDVPHSVVEGRCDFAFTSPPYFAKEIYSSESTQSCNRYATGTAWRDGFLVPMLALQFAALKSGSTAIVNIADVNLKGKTYPLAQWARECAQQVGFKYIRTDEFPMHHRVGANMAEEIATEPVIVLEKP